MMRFVYRHYNRRGDLLYVGCAACPVYRTMQHGRSKWFKDVATITIDRFPDRECAFKAEREAIAVEHPKFNRKQGRQNSIARTAEQWDWSQRDCILAERHECSREYVRQLRMRFQKPKVIPIPS